MKEKINIDLLLKRIDELATKMKISRTQAFEKSGVGKNFKSNLSYSSPSIGKITQLAVFFGVPVSYLLGYTDDPTPEEKAGDKEKSPRVERLLSLLSNMTDDELDKLEKMIDIIKK